MHPATRLITAPRSRQTFNNKDTKMLIIRRLRGWDVRTKRLTSSKQLLMKIVTSSRLSRTQPCRPRRDSTTMSLSARTMLESRTLAASTMRTQREMSRKPRFNSLSVSRWTWSPSCRRHKLFRKMLTLSSKRCWRFLAHPVLRPALWTRASTTRSNRAKMRMQPPFKPLRRPRPRRSLSKTSDKPQKLHPLKTS